VIAATAAAVEPRNALRFIVFLRKCRRSEPTALAGGDCAPIGRALHCRRGVERRAPRLLRGRTQEPGARLGDYRSSLCHGGFAMTIREFWRDVKGRLLEGRHPHEDRWYERGEPFGPADDWERDRDRGAWAGSSEERGGRPWPRDTGYDEYRERGIGAGSGIRGPEITSAFFDVDRGDTDSERGSGRDYRGLGPRNVTRSDDRIREDVCEALMDDEDLDASEIEVTVADGEVTLAGKVASKLDKRLAEDLSARVAGVRDVNNQLRAEL
jgi:hypothetical protein